MKTTKSPALFDVATDEYRSRCKTQGLTPKRPSKRHSYLFGFFLAGHGIGHLYLRNKTDLLATFQVDTEELDLSKRLVWADFG